MKRLLAVILIVCLLTGCANENSDMDQAMTIRERFQDQACDFVLEITADYEDTLTVFSLKCSADQNGNIAFSVIEPKSISGITGNISDLGGELTFDDQVLAIPAVSDDSLSPVMAPWLFIKAMRGGYLDTVSKSENGIRLHIDDNYETTVFSLHIWIDKNGMPEAVDYLIDERRVMSARIKEFVFV